MIYNRLEFYHLLYIYLIEIFSSVTFLIIANGRIYVKVVDLTAIFLRWKKYNKAQTNWLTLELLLIIQVVG